MLIYKKVVELSRLEPFFFSDLMVSPVLNLGSDLMVGPVLKIMNVTADMKL